VTVLSAKFVHCSRASKWAMELSPRFNAGSPTSFEVLTRHNPVWRPTGPPPRTDCLLPEDQAKSVPLRGTMFVENVGLLSF